MRDDDRTVIVGGGLGGLRTAERLRRRGHRGPVTLLAAEPHLPYDRPPLSKAALTAEQEPEGPPLLKDRDACAGLDLDVRTGVRATALDTAHRRIVLDGGGTLGYDRLVIATGVRPRELPALAGLEGVHTLRTWDDCLRLRAGLRAARTVAVVGGGVLGCEIAAAARTLGLEVTLIELAEQPLAAVLGGRIGGIVADLHRAGGVKVRCGARVERAVRSGVVLDDGSHVDADLVVAAAGSVPNTEWLAGSGLVLDDGVLCDRTGRAEGAEDVFAVGDVARMPHPYREGTVRFEHWTSAGDGAALVARNLLAPPGERAAPSEVPYFWTDQYDTKIQCLGLPDPGDEPALAAGSPESGRLLAFYSRDGRVTGGVAFGMPAALARCRKAIAERVPLADLLGSAPWERRSL
ncbi:FAD/NAD(P)-binding oxidoreductase [Actinomadura vinacea]|uniref:FAD/NAD(P)-binding oxidoreductase n=1 Tax=Actinomadura vinacea TaxID=115336 RepID=A0ABN3K4L8_9ACTN